MPLLFSAVSSRALNYDTVFKDLSNPRVFTDFEPLAFACCIRVAVCVQRSLRFYTEFFVAVNKLKNIFYLLATRRILWLSALRFNLKSCFA
jgi:hypothetical protein